MYIKRNSHLKYNTTLYSAAGLIAGFLFLAQLNLHEIIRWDRFEHLTVSFILFFLFYNLFSMTHKSTLLTLIATFSIGVIKEMTDHEAQIFDLFANSLGIILALIFLIFLKQINKNKTYAF
jgi:hypothetical protein